MAVCQEGLMTKLDLRRTETSTPTTAGPFLRPSDPGRKHTKPCTVPQLARSSSASVRPRALLSNLQWLPSQMTRSKLFGTPSISWNPGYSNWKPNWDIVMALLPLAAQGNLFNPSA